MIRPFLMKNENGAETEPREQKSMAPYWNGAGEENHIHRNLVREIDSRCALGQIADCIRCNLSAPPIIGQNPGKCECYSSMREIQAAMHQDPDQSCGDGALMEHFDEKYMQLLLKRSCLRRMFASALATNRTSRLLGF
jgi:hypothetical protein